jgi:adenosylcobinamide-phosphate synthase
MWGYLGERAGRDWTWAGKWAAHADDVLSWVPARITAGFVCLLCKGRGVLQLHKTAQQTPSPNGGWPMGAIALGMNICLEKKGGYCLNRQGELPNTQHVQATLRVCSHVVVVIAVICLGAVLWGLT